MAKSTLSSPAADGSSLGLTAKERRVAQAGMPRPHAHSDLELNYILEGGFTYVIHGRLHQVQRRRLVAFWAAMPHQVTASQQDTVQVWVTVPLTNLLRWQIPAAFVNRALKGNLMVDGLGERPGDLELIRRWAHDLDGGHEDLHRAVHREIEARLIRLAFEFESRPVDDGATEDETAPKAIFERFASAIHQRYQESVPIAGMTRGLGVGADYASQIFRRFCGMTPIEYRTRLRVAHAQRMLLLQTSSVTSIALECGFGSVNRFYAAFRDVCGVAPRQYRSGSR